MPRKTVKMTCRNCGVDFYRPPSRLKNGRGKHCSKSCQYSSKEKPLKKKVESACLKCGNKIYLYPSQAEKAGAGKYCSRDCRDDHWRGVDSPHWQGGNGVYKRGSRWQSIKRAARNRDGQKCQHCGSCINLHVHHKIPFRMFDNDIDANNMENLITLCAPCHRVEDSKWKWIKTTSGFMMFRAGSDLWQEAKKNLLIRKVECCHE